MSKWQENWSNHISTMSIKQLTNSVNFCYKMANSLSRNYTDGKGVERRIWKEKAKMAIEQRKKQLKEV